MGKEKVIVEFMDGTKEESAVMFRVENGGFTPPEKDDEEKEK